RFYVRGHFPVPEVDVARWGLRVEGAVTHPLTVPYEELRAMPARSLAVTLECAGNSRSFLSPPVAGVPWGMGAIGTAEWTGVPLTAVLARAGLAPDVVDVVFEGADYGEAMTPPMPNGPIHFARSLPLRKALSPDVLLAYQMNGAELSPDHGFPLRLIVPGWYGMACIKWLHRIVVLEQPFQGYFQSVDYAIWERQHGIPTRVPLGEMTIKAQIARPYCGEALPVGRPYRVFGAAWAGESEVQQVEVSTDNGQSWSDARLLGEPIPYSWRLWEHEWRPTQTGRHTLMARATGTQGRTQPLSHLLDRENYVINHVLPVPVEVR
ncbi:MAG: sulfite oxidase, partial [Armatimonadetes bacterium]|nr:sulfite oxidase [Armatimonadota bacterium]